MSERSRGRIRWFSHQGRYARIQRGPGFPDVFVQIADLQDVVGVQGLENGDFVEFSVEQTPTGPTASNIVLLSSK